MRSISTSLNHEMDRKKIVKAGQSQLHSYRKSFKKTHHDVLLNKGLKIGEFPFPEQLSLNLEQRKHIYSKCAPKLADQIQRSLNLPNWSFKSSNCDCNIVHSDSANVSLLDAKENLNSIFSEELNLHKASNNQDHDENCITEMYDQVLCFIQRNSSLTPITLQHIEGCIEQLKNIHLELKNRPKYASVLEVLLTKVNGISNMLNKKIALEQDFMNLLVLIGKPVDLKRAPGGKSLWITASQLKEIEARFAARDEGSIAALESENRRLKDKLSLFQKQIKQLQKQNSPQSEAVQNADNENSSIQQIKPQQLQQFNDANHNSSHELAILRRSLEEKDALVDAMRHSLKMVVLEKEAVDKELEHLKIQLGSPEPERHALSIIETPIDAESVDISAQAAMAGIANEENQADSAEQSESVISSLVHSSNHHDDFAESLRQNIMRAQTVIDQSLMSPSINRQNLLQSTFADTEAPGTERPPNSVDSTRVPHSRPIITTLQGHKQVKMHSKPSSFSIFSLSWIYQLFGTGREAEKYNKHGAFIL